LIKLAGFASAILVAPLVIADAVSQFSVAVADKFAAIGNMEEVTKSKIWNYFSWRRRDCLILVIKHYTAYSLSIKSLCVLLFVTMFGSHIRKQIKYTENWFWCYYSCVYNCFCSPG